MSKMSYVQEEVQLSDEVEESAARMIHAHALMRWSRVML